jgi:hypothetical protein
VRVGTGPTTTVKVETDASACPDVLPPPDPDDPCTTPIEPYESIGPDGTLNVKVLACIAVP